MKQKKREKAAPGLKLALEARKRSYSPYSKVKVGAAIKTSSGRYFSGANIENASFSATLCAERVAIFYAIATGEKKVTDIYVATDFSDPWPPCGMCRQVISEFATKDCQIHLCNKAGIQKSFPFRQLFPQGFEPAYLLKKRK